MKKLKAPHGAVATIISNNSLNLKNKKPVISLFGDN